MRTANISFGKLLYPSRAKQSMNNEQIKLIDLLSNSTGTDVAVIGKDKNGNTEAMITPSKDIGIIVKERGNLKIGEILSRVYLIALVANTDLLSARDLVKDEIENPTNEKYPEFFSGLRKMLEEIYKAMAQDGLTISSEIDKLKNKDWSSVRCEQKFGAERAEIEKLCQQQGIKVSSSKCVLFDDD